MDVVGKNVDGGQYSAKLQLPKQIGEDLNQRLQDLNALVADLQADFMKVMRNSN